jgi:regulator of sigma E protease
VSIGLVILGLLFLILVHELGHFVVAKAVGAKATKFYVGFPPPLIRRQRGETEYGIGAIPVGGYVRIVGMTRPQASDLWKVNDAVAEAAHRRPADVDDRFGASVGVLRERLDNGDLDHADSAATTALATLEDERELLDPRTAAEARKDLTRLAEETDPRAYWRLPVWKRISIIAAGPAANLLTALIILTCYFMAGTPIVDISQRVESVNANWPAQAAGLQAGDRIVAVNGSELKAEDVRNAIQASNGSTLVLTVERDGQRVQLQPVAPKQGEGGWLLGFRFGTERVGTKEYNPIEALDKSVRTIGWVTRETIKTLGSVVTSQESRDQLSTPVGIVDQGAPTVKQGTFPGVLALISLALAIFNLLPFLPLDGGHIVFALAEKARGGRPISRAVFERVSVVGIALMLVLFLFGLTNDIGRLSSP